MFAGEVYNLEEVLGRENRHDETSIVEKTDGVIHLVADILLDIR